MARAAAVKDDAFHKYSVENFVEAPQEDFICSICQNVFDNPQECPCGHLFCCKCIQDWLKRKTSCPICRAKVRQFELKKVTFVLRNIINKMKLKCPNAVNGCCTQPSLEEFDNHGSNCGFAKVSCKYKNCTKKEVLRKNVKKHELQCTYRTVTCTKGCGHEIPKNQVSRHSCIKLLSDENKELKKTALKSEEHIKDLLAQLREKESELQIYKNDTPPFRSWFYGGNHSSFDDFSDIAESISTNSSYDAEIFSDYYDELADYPEFPRPVVPLIRLPRLPTPPRNLSNVQSNGTDNNQQNHTSSQGLATRRMTRSVAQVQRLADDNSQNSINSSDTSSANQARTRDSEPLDLSNSLTESQSNSETNGGPSVVIRTNCNGETSSSSVFDSSSQNSSSASTIRNNPPRRQNNNRKRIVPSSSNASQSSAKRVLLTNNNNVTPTRKSARISQRQASTNPVSSALSSQGTSSGGDNGSRDLGPTSFTESNDSSDDSMLSDPESESSYEVHVPDSTWEMLQNYSSNESDDDFSPSLI